MSQNRISSVAVLNDSIVGLDITAEPGQHCARFWPRNVVKRAIYYEKVCPSVRPSVTLMSHAYMV